MRTRLGNNKFNNAGFNNTGFINTGFITQVRKHTCVNIDA